MAPVNQPTNNTPTTQGFWYANGVALSRDESYLVVAETDRIRLMKHWLKGPKVGGVCVSAVVVPHKVSQ